MKKLYILSISLILFIFSNAQVQTKYNLSNEQISLHKPSIENNLSTKAYSDTIAGMYWDFNGTLPAAWSVIDNTGNGYVWMWSDIGPTGAYTGTPTWDTPMPVLASSTSANGFMMFQADNFNTDQTTGQLLASYIDHDSYIQTESLDFTGINSVILKFQQRFRVCCSYVSSDLFVSVSNDGVIWKDYSVGATNSPINYHSCDENTVNNVSLNISNVAANQSTVYIRFWIRGLSHYYWMIDDVAITEGPQFDLVIEEYYDNFFTINSGSYSKIPQAQAVNGYVGWKAAVFNNGAQDINNVTLNADVLKNGSPFFSSNSNAEYPISSLPALSLGAHDSLSRDTIFLLNNDFYTTSQGLPPSFVPNYMGTYQINLNATMNETDENTQNNSFQYSFTVNDSVYARDNGIVGGAIGPQTWAGMGNNGDVFGVRYQIIDTTTYNSQANSISIYIHPSTTTGANAPIIEGAIYMSDGMGWYNLVLITDPYQITPADTGTWLTIPFMKDGFSEFLWEGDYLAGIGIMDYNGGDFFIGNDITTKQESWTTLWDLDGAGFVYFPNYNSTPMIRLNFESVQIIANPDTIYGKILVDDNCIIDGTEQAMENIFVKTVPGNFYGVTNNMGEFRILTDSGSYQVTQIIPQSSSLLINPLCPTPNYYDVQFDSLGMSTSGIDFFNEAVMCPYLTIDLNSDRRRRCFRNNTMVHYCNDGYADATGVEVTVEFPDYVHFIGANYPYSIDTVGNYVFDIGTLAQGDCGYIHIIDSVACINGLMGLTQCTKAWITPANDCIYQLDTASYNQWDHSSVMVEGECIGDTIVRFTITNTGDFGAGDMQVPSEYRIYRDLQLIYTNSFQLLGQEELVIDLPANGQTYRLEADQHPMHPGNSHPNATIEACGNPLLSTGFVNMFPMDDADAEVEIDCMEILDSYDPNDKSVSPSGWSAHNFLMPGTVLDFVIRFQNTGNDTAYKVVIVDTLSEHLDISTFEAGISSHPYTLGVTGQGSPILTFTFDNINLPDSITNELNSHGYVKYKIAPYDSLPMGTEIENTAHIFFDYNLPIVTNTTLVTISDSVIYGYPLVVKEVKAKPDIIIYPNPTTGKIYITAKGIEKVVVINVDGREIYSGAENEIDLSQNQRGIYMIEVTTAEEVVVQKVILN